MNLNKIRNMKNIELSDYTELITQLIYRIAIKSKTMSNDEIIKELYNLKIKKPYFYREDIYEDSVNSVIKIITTMNPTKYDVNKVITELINERYYQPIEYDEKVYNFAINNAIDIVKRGFDKWYILENERTRMEENH